MNAQQAHATALRLAKRNGFAIRCSHEDASTESANGQLTPGATINVDGFAVQDDTGGDPAAYQALKLIETSAVRVLFVPSTINQNPMVGDRSTFESRTVKSVEPYRVGAHAEIVSAYVVFV